MTEQLPTAVLLTTFGLLMAISVVFSRLLDRLGVPIVLLFLLLGMLAGSEGIGGIEFQDFRFAFQIGTIALALILFDGGLNTSLDAIRVGIAPASVLATFGVAGTACLMAVGCHWAGIPWDIAFLIGAIVSSTDAATVFSVLRGSRLNLSRRVGVTLELESGLNDPLAVILTIALTKSLVSGDPIGWSIVWMVPVQLAIGAAVGISLGWLCVMILRRLRLQAGGLYAVFTMGSALSAFGVATLLYGSGFLAVYAAAVVIGNSPIPYRSGLTRIHDAIAWLGQISMFLMLGLLVTPSELLPLGKFALILAIFLATVARPIVVWLCLLPFRFTTREMAYTGWVGLRGAVPIILATIPMLADIPQDIARAVFNVVFFVVVVNAIIPGALLRYLTRWLKLEVAEAPTPSAMLEINSTQLLKGDIASFYIDTSLAVSNVPLSKIPFPKGAAVILLVRGEELMAARGDSILRPGDHVYVFCHPEDRPYIQLLFGQPQAD